MTQEELEKNKFASQRVITVADELIKKLDENDKMIGERRITTNATSNFSREFVSVLTQILREVKSPNVDDIHAHIENISNIISSIIEQLNENIRNSNDEVVRLEATQEGMRRALQAVRESGTIQQRELEKIEELSRSENPESRRNVGEHPETMMVKKNAASLKKSRESSNI